ncbi:PH domain-containing protein [Planctomycetaceae bacterium SH139]
MMAENKPTSPAEASNPEAEKTEHSPAAKSPTKPASPEQAVSSLREGLTEGDGKERSLWKGGFSPKAMIGSWILTAIVSIAAIVLGAMFEWLPVIPVLIGIAVLWLIVGSVYAYRRLGVSYELTTQRFIHQSGILSRRTDRIEVIDIDDVSCAQGPIERIFGVGGIMLESSDRSHPTLNLRGIANVKEISSLIDDVRRQERRRRSLHIEAI